jgi:energy-converting hydrogenase Eha subunit A
MGQHLVLWMHVAAGCVAWILGAIALWKNLPGRRSRGTLAAFHWSVLAVGVTASVLVAYAPAQLWWLWLLAILSYGLALLGYLAPRDRSLGWLRLGIHGQGGACIALVTATFVVSVDGLTRIAAWTLPTLIGVPLLELWYRRAAARAPEKTRA